jgi:phage terminase large subunit-like protein
MARAPYYFDKALAQAAVEFFPRFLRHTKGEWAGKPFQLAPWQEHHTGQIFGWRRRKDGTRRYRRVRGWIARKNGKSSWFAGIGHLLTVGDGEPGAEVYTHALDKSQASVVFDMAAHMVALSEPLSNLYEVTKTSLFCPATMSTFRALSGEAWGKHGLSPHGIIGDEAHAWANDRLHTFLWQGTGARRQPLDATISTAGEIKTYGHWLWEQSMAVLEKPDLDPEMYVFHYAADPNDDWTDPKVWKKANPNLGVSLDIADLRAECKAAQTAPRLENDFKRYKLNIWVEQAKRWFPMHRWADNTLRPNDKSAWKHLAEQMAGRRCFGGLDLGSTNDITCLVWVFPPENEGERVTLIPQFWVPEKTIGMRDSPRTPYRKWVSDGALLTTPGNVTDYDFIEHRVMADAGRYQVQKLGYDPWNATQVAVHLQDEGAPMIEFRQGFGSMAAPSKEIERLFLASQLEHGNHPVLEWMFGNATYRKDPAGNIKPDKEKAAEKIDGVVASVMGVGLMNAGAAPDLGAALNKAILARAGFA